MSSQPGPATPEPAEAQRWFAGLMTGTSADGVDAALVEVHGRGLDAQVRLESWLSEPLPEELRHDILRATTPRGADASDLAGIHARLGHVYAEVLERLCESSSADIAEITCVGCHGQTVWHGPREACPTTLQLGAAAVIAERTGISVVNDFRWRDLAAGGQGAPLVPIVDWLLLRSDACDRIAANLGGIINLSYLPCGGALEDVQAFDVGPGNILLDRLTQELTRGSDRYDAGGRLAVQGRKIEPLLSHWAGHPFLSRPPPKSTGREEFGEGFVQEALAMAAENDWPLLDVLCTATHFGAGCLADAVVRFLPVPTEGPPAGSGAETEKRSDPALPPIKRPDSPKPPPAELILSGGGVHNGLLVRALSERLPGLIVCRSDELGLPVDAKEAIAFAVLAALAVDAVPGNVPSATGAAGPRLLGTFTPGSRRNWGELAEQIVAAQENSPRFDVQN